LFFLPVVLFLHAQSATICPRSGIKKRWIHPCTLKNKKAFVGIIATVPSERRRDEEGGHALWAVDLLTPGKRFDRTNYGFAPPRETPCGSMTDEERKKFDRNAVGL